MADEFAQPRVGRRKGGDKSRFPRIHYDGRAGQSAFRTAAQFGKGRQQRHRQVVHTKVAQVFQGIERRLFAGTAQSGDDHKVWRRRRGRLGATRHHESKMAGQAGTRRVGHILCRANRIGQGAAGKKVPPTKKKFGMPRQASRTA